MAFKLCLVEDEKNLNQLLTSYLCKEGWEVISLFDGTTALKAISQKPDLWILDIMLPDIDGFQIIDEIKRALPHVPVIFISARDADLDRIIGLEKGSDDYLAKPFLPRELVIRAKKLLERVYLDQYPPAAKQLLKIPPYLLNLEKRIVMENNRPIDLTVREYDLLILFVLNRKKAFSRNEILESLWGSSYFGTDRVVDDLVRRLRKKMPQLNLETIYGFGYRLV